MPLFLLFLSSQCVFLNKSTAFIYQFVCCKLSELKLAENEEKFFSAEKILHWMLVQKIYFYLFICFAISDKEVFKAVFCLFVYCSVSSVNSLSLRSIFSDSLPLFTFIKLFSFGFCQQIIPLRQLRELKDVSSKPRTLRAFT